MTALEDSRMAFSKRCGENAESLTIQVIPELKWVPDSEAHHYDARTIEAISTSADLPIVGRFELEEDTPVEIKSASVVYGENQRNGRFHLRKQQHELLIEDDGVYLFVVCEPRVERELIAMKIVDAADASEFVSSWIDSDGRPLFSKFAWTRVFDEAEVFETA